jgi:thiosulfate reductase cytochrome b subunit
VLFLAYGCCGQINFQKQKQLKPSLKYVLFITIFAVLGFSREFLFVNINDQLYSLYYYYNDYKFPSSLNLLQRLDYSTLYYLKYPLTILYFLAFFFTGFFAVKLICTNKKNALWVVYIYVILLVLSGISMAYNYFMNNQLNGDEYTFSRWLMGIAQSPLVAFFTIASSKLYNKFQTEQ